MRRSDSSVFSQPFLMIAVLSLGGLFLLDGRADDKKGADKAAEKRSVPEESNVEEKSGAEQDVTNQEKPKGRGKSDGARSKGRLPSFFGGVVNDEQAEEIRKIQAEYQAKIDPLQQQIRDLLAERDGKIEKTLTDAQKKEIAKVRSDRMEKRKSARKEKKS